MTADSSKLSDRSAATSSSPEAIVDVRGLGVWYRRHLKPRRSLQASLLGALSRRQQPVLWALRNVDLECREGDAVCIVGPNGAGKSTLCRVLSGILVPDEGTIAVGAKVSPLLSIGSGLQPLLTGRENIRLYAAYLEIPEARLESLTEEIIDFAEVGDTIDEPIRYYSAGTRSRLSFSIATALDPEILILDEALATGDQYFRGKSAERMQEMIRRSNIIIAVTHSPSTLRGICNKGLWLEDGAVARYGDFEEVTEAYAASTRPARRGAEGPLETPREKPRNKPAPGAG